MVYRLSSRDFWSGDRVSENVVFAPRRIQPEGRDRLSEETMTRRYIGEGVSRKEDRPLLTGRGQYLDNIRVPGGLHAVVVRCPFAHARVKLVDTGPALAVPGVVAAFSGADLSGDWAEPLPLIWPVTPEVRIPDHWPLAPVVAKFAGDGVAVVAGRTLAEASDGAEAVAVDYEPLPAVTDVEDALRDDAPTVHEQFGTNRCYQLEFMRGEVDAVFSGAEVVVTRRLRVPRVIPSPMETRAVLAESHPNGDFTLWTTTQVPHLVRRMVSGSAGIPEHQLRVVAPDVGGAFGSKVNVYGEEALALALTRRLGRPVKWVEDRSESAVATTHGRGQVQQVSLAARSDGTIVGIRVSVLASMGAYLQLETPGIPALGMLLFGGAYGAEAYAYQCTGVFTNEPPTGAYRGVGRAEALYAIERTMDALAREVGVDPAEIRRRNFLPRGELVFNAGGIPYDSVDYEKTLDVALELAGYAKLRSDQAVRRERGEVRQLGIGLSSYVDSSGVGPSPILGRVNYQGGGWEAGRVKVLPTGKLEVFTGTCPQGQGHETLWSQIAAQTLEVPLEDVAVFHGDTAVVPQGAGTFGSRSVAVGGAAIHIAAKAVLAKSRRIAAHLLESAEEDVEFSDATFSVAGAPERSVSLAEVARAAHLAHNLPEGTAPGLDEMAVFEPQNFTYPFGTHVAVVEVDAETGRVGLVKYVAVDDCGNVINPILLEGQIHGGVAQGVGEALFEEVRYTPEGQLETASFLNYLVPSPADLPPIEVARTTTPTVVNPLGAKGIAEAGTIAAPPAVMNAVVDALAPFGVQDVDMPATPERVWAALRRPGEAATPG